YHQATYKPSKNLDEPLKTPSARAKAGKNSAATHQANNPPPSPASKRRTPAPAPVRAATTNPATKHAGNCRNTMRAEEKSKGLVPKRDSRAPIADQISAGHNHAAVRIKPREYSSGAASCAISSPNATAYHHQR